VSANRYDYIIAGGGSAGCVLARRLSDDPDINVLLIEAGGPDLHPLFHMPAGFAKMTKGIGSWGWSTVPQKHLKDRVLRYTQAKVKVLFVSFKANPVPQADPKAKKILTESEARAKVDKLLADIRGGADFVKFVKENSDDAESAGREGDWGDLIRRSDKLPDNIKAAIFSLKPKQVSDPVRVSTGFYLFRLEELTAQPFEQVRDDIWIEIRQGHFNKWLENTQKDIQVKIENPEFFINAAAGK